MQNVVGPTLVAMAAKFGLGAEIQSLTGLYVCKFVYAYQSCSAPPSLSTKLARSNSVFFCINAYVVHGRHAYRL